jgi:hypothetical protein
MDVLTLISVQMLCTFQEFYAISSPDSLKQARVPSLTVFSIAREVPLRKVKEILAG